MNKIYSLMLALGAMLFSVNAMAEDVKLSKCNGDATTQGYGASSGTSISAATQFSETEVAPLSGGTLTKVRAYLSATNMTSLEIWVKNNVSDARKLASVTVSQPKIGWNEVELPEPIEISETSTIALGYTYAQTTANPCYCLTFSNVMSTGGLYLAIGTTFEDYSGYYGNLSIEGTVTGITVSESNIKVLGISTSSPFCKTQSVATASVPIQNTGADCHQVTLRLTCNGKSYDNEINLDMQFLQMEAVQANFYTPDEVTFGAEVTARVVAIDGVPFESNTASATFDAYARLYDRTVVIEEGTGTWCGWCVRGMVAMDRMKEKYPDTFIGIAAHSANGATEPMNISGYASGLGISGFPGCTVDRAADMKGLDVDFAAFEEYYEYERARGTYADFTFDAYFDESGKIVGQTTATFDYSKENADIRMVYVLLEDSITGYSQANYYSGGAYGAMGGFENKTNPTSDVVFNDVARKLYPSFKGTKNSLAADIVAGETYTHTFAYALPTTPTTCKVKDKNNLRLVALMLDGASGEIINAHQVHIAERDTNDAIVSTTAATTTTDNIYSIDGRRIDAPRRGLNIINGRKVVVR